MSPHLLSICDTLWVTFILQYQELLNVGTILTCIPFYLFPILSQYTRKYSHPQFHIQICTRESLHNSKFPSPSICVIRFRYLSQHFLNNVFQYLPLTCYNPYLARRCGELSKQLKKIIRSSSIAPGLDSRTF